MGTDRPGQCQLELRLGHTTRAWIPKAGGHGLLDYCRSWLGESRGLLVKSVSFLLEL